MPFLFLLFVVVPIIEIWLLIQVGGAIGLGWTIVTVIATAIAGAWLVRSQGLTLLGRVRTEMIRGRVPAGDMLEGLMVLIAGAVLLTPGFFTDAIGFCLLVPWLRRWLARRIIVPGVFQAAHRGSSASPPTGPKKVIDGEFRRDKD